MSKFKESDTCCVCDAPQNLRAFHSIGTWLGDGVFTTTEGTLNLRRVLNIEPEYINYEWEELILE